MIETVRANGTEVEVLLNENEGHWFVNEESNRELYREDRALPGLGILKLRQ